MGNETQRTYSRRDFLKIAGVGSIAALYMTEDSSESTPTIEEILGKNPILEDIASYRNELGLSPIPPELRNLSSISSTEWIAEKKPFENNLAGDSRSYGMINKFIQDESFGKNAGRLVHGIKVDENSPYSISFIDNNGRYCLVPENVNTFDLDRYVNVVLHEAVGHGSDPTEDKAVYPAGMLLAISRSKWKMLSQAFSVEGQFFNHPKDEMLPEVKRKIGETVALNYRKGRLNESFEEVGEEYLQKEIEELARAEGSTLESLKFNKRRCAQLGENMFGHIKRGSAVFKGELADWYEETLEKSLVEIYAEMIRIAVLHPEKINFNQQILEGCSEILSTIREGDLDLNKLRKKANQLSPEILSRKEYEEELIASLQEDIEVSQFGNPDVWHVLSSQVSKNHKKDLFEQFVLQGEIPQDTQADIETTALAGEYARLRSYIEAVYSLKNVVNSSLDVSFDPDMDIWEIRKIEYATNNAYIRNLIRQLREEPQKINLEELKDCINIMSAFIVSDAFGS